MKTKEDILAAHLSSNRKFYMSDMPEIYKAAIYEAMDEHAKQFAMSKELKSFFMEVLNSEIRNVATSINKTGLEHANEFLIILKNMKSELEKLETL